MQMLRTSSDPLASVWRFLPCFSRVPFPNWDDDQQLTNISCRVQQEQAANWSFIDRPPSLPWLNLDRFVFLLQNVWLTWIICSLLKQTIHGMKTNFTQSCKVLGRANFCQGSIDQNFHPTNLRFRFRSLNIGRNQFQSSSFCFFPPC